MAVASEAAIGRVYVGRGPSREARISCVRVELRRARAGIEHLVGQPCIAFAWPWP